MQNAAVVGKVDFRPGTKNQCGPHGRAHKLSGMVANIPAGATTKPWSA